MCPDASPPGVAAGTTNGEPGGTAAPSSRVEHDVKRAVEHLGTVGPVGLLPGTELVGEFRGSGYRQPPRLVQRGDGQLVRLPEMLYVLARIVGEWCGVSDVAVRGVGNRDSDLLAAVATAASRETGWALSVEHIAFLLDRKLAPLGVSTYSDGSVPEITKPTPFLSLRVRAQMFRPAVTWAVGGVLGWLFYPLVVAALLAGAGIAEWWVFATQNVPLALRETMSSPGAILAVVALAVISTVFHECGHATACRYSGAAPGGMGCGIYLVWPAFYTDITNSYRLDRRGRMRTDLGGVYFNAIFLFIITAAYVFTGWTPLLVGVLSVNLELIQQLLPTLRFDGYYIVADLVGIPDLFKYIGPILARYVARRPADERLTMLKRWPQMVVTFWVLAVIPALALELGYIAWQLPAMIASDLASISNLVAGATFGAHPVLGVVSAVTQIILLTLPVAGVIFILFNLARAGYRLCRRHVPSLVRRSRAA